MGDTRWYSTKISLIGLWRLTEGNTVVRFLYAIYNKLILALFCIYAVTITCDLHEASQNIVDFGDDMCIIIGVYLVLFKTVYFDLYSTEILKVIKSIHYKFQIDFTLHEHRYADIKQKICYYRRLYYLQDTTLLFGNMIMGFLLFIAISLQPMFMEPTGRDARFILPLRAKFPVLRPAESQFDYTIVYTFQSITTLLLIENIVFMDNTGGTILNQICLQFQLLCFKFESLNRDNNLTMAKLQLRNCIIEHQNLIKFVCDVNRLFHPMYLAQLVASMMIICLTAFESTLTMHDKTIFLKFMWYMFSSFMQLLYWCWLGNKVSFLSTKIQNSIWNCHWINTDAQFKKDLMFVIQRSQKPILSGSYSYYTILRSVYVEEKHPSC